MEKLKTASPRTASTQEVNTDVLLKHQEKHQEVKLQCFDYFTEIYDITPDEFDQLNYVVDNMKELYEKSFQFIKKEDSLNYNTLKNKGLHAIQNRLEILDLQGKELIKEIKNYQGRFIRDKFSYEIESIFLIKKLHHELVSDFSENQETPTRKSTSLAKIIQQNLVTTCLNIRLGHLQNIDTNSSDGIKSLVQELKTYMINIPYTLRSIKKHLAYPYQLVQEYALAEKIENFYESVNITEIFKPRFQNIGITKMDKLTFLEESKMQISYTLDLIETNPKYIKWRNRLNALDEKSRILITELMQYDSTLWSSALASNYKKELTVCV